MASLTFSALGTVAELPQPAGVAVAAERLRAHPVDARPVFARPVGVARRAARPVVAPDAGHALVAVLAGPTNVAAAVGAKL